MQSYRLQLLDPSVLEEPAVLQRGKVAERAVGPAPIVIHPPVLDEPPSVSEGEKPMLVQALVSEPAVEALDEGVLNGLARLDEVQPHAPLIGPLVQAPELIRTNRGRQGQPGFSSHTLATSPAHR